MPKKYKFTKSFTYNDKRYFIHGDTLQEVYEKIALKKFALENGVKHVEKTMLFKDWAEEWVDSYLSHSVSEETLDSYLSVMRVHILPFLGHLRLNSIKSIHIQKMINDLSGGSARMIKRTHNLTSRILKAAMKNNLILDNPAEDIVFPKGSESTHRAITDTERKYILKVAEYHRAGTWIYIMLYAGLRPSEACALQWKHINFKDRYIQVEQTVKKNGGIGAPKTLSGIRKIPLSQILFEKLEPLQSSPFDFVCQNSKADIFQLLLCGSFGYLLKDS